MCVARIQGKVGNFETDPAQAVGELSRVRSDLGVRVLVTHSALEMKRIVDRVVARLFGTGKPVSLSQPDPARHRCRRLFAELGFDTTDLQRYRIGVRIGQVECPFVRNPAE